MQKGGLMVEKEKDKNYLILKVLIYFLTTILVFLAGGFTFYFLQTKVLNKSEEKKTVPAAEKQPAPVEEGQEQPMINSEPASTNTLESNVPVVEEKSDFELIKEALATRFSKDLGATTANIGKQIGNYVSGGVKFEGEIGGAWFLAYKGASGWVIVSAGNGTIPCTDIEPYNFPVELVPECSREDGSIVYR